MMIATRRNMQALLDKHGEKIAVPGVFCYSPRTGERASASPGDYFDVDLDYPLTDYQGNLMFLARETRKVEYVPFN